MKIYKNIVFDLDGTLSDSSAGIVNGFKYALSALNYEGAGESDLRKHIGAPLLHTFEEHFFKGKPALAQQAVVLYREYYNRSGKFENELYPGLINTLDVLQRHYNLYVLTNKMHAFAIDIINHFKLDTYFKAVHGINPANNLTKESIALELNKQLFEGQQQQTIMVGDTVYDMECAAKAGWDSCFVTYGFGHSSSLGSFTPNLVAHSFAQLAQLF